MSSKILALTDALGNLVKFTLMLGQRHDIMGVQVVISQRPKRQTPLDIDLEVYKWRHLIENFFGKLKEFKRIVMRSDKTDSSFAAAIHLAAAVINSR